jgi:16S rRNA (cytidine1402-2'-O)-methyltransferase
VIVVAGAAAAAPTSDEWEPALIEALREQTLRAAVDEVAQRFGVKRKQVYDAALALKASR